MHVLTKIFIVLVSLLAVMLVPLVVVYAHNENSYKSRLVDAEAKSASSAMALTAAEARSASREAGLQSSIDEYRAQIGTLQQNQAASEAEVRQLQSQVTTSNAANAEINTHIQTIASQITAGQQLTESLVGELRELRAMAVTLERQKVELDEALRDVTTQLDVAEQARRALAEELQRVKEERAAALSDVSKAIAMGFNPTSDARIGVRDGIIPDRSLTATILRVERSSTQVLAEIDAGEKDGVKKDWIMAIANGGEFIANIRIINVDVNRATGVISLEDAKDRGAVAVGMKATAYPE